MVLRAPGVAVKLWRSERGMIVAVFIVAATVAFVLGKLEGREYAALMALALQVLVTYKAMPAQSKASE